MTKPTEDEEKEGKHEHHLRDDAEAKLARHLMMTVMIVTMMTMMIVMMTTMMMVMMMVVEQAPGHGSHKLQVVCEG